MAFRGIKKFFLFLKNVPYKNGFGFALMTLCLTIAVSFFLKNRALSWGSGFLYIIYDTWLLALVTRKTSKFIKQRAPSLHYNPQIGKKTTVAILVTGRNESSVILNCLKGVEEQSDQADEVYFIDDGSIDNSIALLTQHYHLTFKEHLGSSKVFPQFKVWKKPHSGKARSLNQVWPHVKSKIIVTIDADTILEKQAIAFIRQAFHEEAELWAVGGVLTPHCRKSFTSKFFQGFQRFEYIRAFLARLAWMQMNSLLLVSGAFAAYRAEALAKVGGYHDKSLVEDYELIHRLYRYAYEHGEKIKVRVIAGARAATDAPNSISSFLKQRKRWFGGFLQTQYAYRDMIGNPDFGNVGRFMLPIKTLDTLQPIYGLVAFVFLIKFVLFDRYIHPVILVVVSLKLVLDLAFHFRSIQLYFRWQSEKVTASSWVKAAVATLFEPSTFQLLRHLGALWGWVAFFQGKNDWAAQRPLSMHSEKPSKKAA